MSQYVDPRPLFEAHIAKPLKDLPAALDPFILKIGGIVEQQRRRRIAGVQRVAELLQDRPAELLQELRSIESDHGSLPHSIDTAVTLAARASLDPGDARTITIVTGESALHRALSAVRSYLAELRDASWWDRPSAFVAPSQDELIAHRRERLERFDFENNPARAAEKQSRDAALIRGEEIGDTLPDVDRRLNDWREVPPGDAHGLLLKEETLAAMLAKKHALESELRAMRGDHAGAVHHGVTQLARELTEGRNDNILCTGGGAREANAGTRKPVTAAVVTRTRRMTEQFGGVPEFESVWASVRDKPPTGIQVLTNPDRISDGTHELTKANARRAYNLHCRKS